MFTSPIVYDENNVKRVTELLSTDDGFVANQIKVTTVQIVPGLKINELQPKRMCLPNGRWFQKRRCSAYILDRRK